MDRHEKEREDYYNRNSWETGAWEVREGQREVMEMELISREKAIQRQEEENRILGKAKYNKSIRI